VLRWSQRARADLKAIHDYIAKDSPLNAKAVARELLQRASTLPATPRIGRAVPELNDPNVREAPQAPINCAAEGPLTSHTSRYRRHKRTDFDANSRSASILPRSHIGAKRSRTSTTPAASEANRLYRRRPCPASSYPSDSGC
jgi:hypothetical protein